MVERTQAGLCTVKSEKSYAKYFVYEIEKIFRSAALMLQINHIIC